MTSLRDGSPFLNLKCPTCDFEIIGISDPAPNGPPGFKSGQRVVRVWAVWRTPGAPSREEIEAVYEVVPMLERPPVHSVQASMVGCERWDLDVWAVTDGEQFVRAATSYGLVLDLQYGLYPDV